MARPSILGLACWTIALGLQAFAASAAEAPPEAPPETDPRAAGPYGRTPDDLVPYSRSAAPYRRFYLTPLLFRGPGREKAPPVDLDTVRIGLLAPLEGTPDARAGRVLQRGVEMALAEANAGGGYRGIPFELVSRNDQALWGSSGNTLVELAYGEQVWALIGSIDSNSTHVALRAALKAELCIVNVGSSDPTMTETGIPWIVRITPDDRQTGYRLARLLFDERDHKRVAVLRSSERYGRFGVKEFRDAARRLGRPVPMEILIRSGETDYRPQLRRVADAEPDAVVLWLKSREAAVLVRQMRELGMTQPIFGTDRLQSGEFLDWAGETAEGIVATSWTNPSRGGDAEWDGFRERFQARFGEPPDAVAAYGYDAGRLVVEAVRQQGLNRARIRDALMSLRSYSGVGGEMEFDATSNNVAPVGLARVEGGRFVFE